MKDRRQNIIRYRYKKKNTFNNLKIILDNSFVPGNSLKWDFTLSISLPKSFHFRKKAREIIYSDINRDETREKQRKYTTKLLNTLGNSFSKALFLSENGSD